MIEEIRKILSDDNIKEMACEYTGAEEEYQGFHKCFLGAKMVLISPRRASRAGSEC